MFSKFTFEDNKLSMDDRIKLLEKTDVISDRKILLSKLTNIYNNNINNANDKKHLNCKNLYGVEELMRFFPKSSIYSEYNLRNWISNPTNDKKFLKNRQRIIKYFITFPKLTQKISNIISRHDNSENENKILWFWDEITEDIQSLYDEVYFNYPIIDKYLNDNKIVLNLFNLYKIYVAPALTILIPILSFIVPYILLLFYKVDIKVNEYITLINQMIKSMMFADGGKSMSFYKIFVAGIYVFLYLQSGYTSVSSAISTYKIIEILRKKITYVSQLVEDAREIHDTFGLRLINDAISINIDSELEYFKNIFYKDSDHSVHSVPNNFGYILSRYTLFLNNKNKLINILRYIGEVNSYLSIVSLFNRVKNIRDMNNPSELNKNVCFTRFVDGGCSGPLIIAQDMLHPDMMNNNNNNVITNSIILGKKYKNMLITGPNKAGKSTFIKGIAINILLSQTIGIAIAKKFIITPFTVINSYLHITDTVGKESLFEAEINRIKEYLLELKKLKSNEFAFNIMDEIFTSTNNTERQIAAKNLLSDLCMRENNISLITTHFTELNTLEKEMNNKITNFKFEMKHGPTGEIIYPRVLKKGYSTQKNALELISDINI